METLAGQANLMVQARLGGSSAGGGVVGFAHANLMVVVRLAGSSIAGGGVVGFAGAFSDFLSSFLPPHANIMHLFLPNVASTPCSPADAADLGAAIVSFSCPTKVILCSDGFFV